jgi:profilin
LFFIEAFNYSNKMSWQAYVDQQMMDKKLKKAAIAGFDGNIWAKSENFNVTPEEVKKIVENYENAAVFASSGISLEGQKYVYLSGTEDVLRAKQGKGGVHIFKTNQAVLLGVYDDPMQPAEAATVTEALGSYLKNFGY